MSQEEYPDSCLQPVYVARNSGFDFTFSVDGALSIHNYRISILANSDKRICNYSAYCSRIHETGITRIKNTDPDWIFISGISEDKLDPVEYK